MSETNTFSVRSLRLIFLGLLLAATSLAEPSRYHDPANSFSVIIPSNWSIGPNQNGSALYLTNGRNGIAVHKLDGKELASTVQTLHQEYKKSKLKLETERPLQVNQVPGHVCVWGGTDGVILNSVLQSGDKLFFIQGEVYESTTAAAEDFMALTNSLRVEAKNQSPPAQTDEPDVDSF